MEEKQSDKQSIGKKIRSWRMKRELTQEGLARKADIPYTTLAKVESGVIQNPSIETVRKLAVGLEITIDELIS